MRTWSAARGRSACCASALAAVAVVVLLSGSVASAATDVYDNIAPAPQTQGGLADEYPLSRYTLDDHTADATQIGIGPLSADIPDVSAIPAQIAYFLASVIWVITAFLAKALITLFNFAFTLDLVNGSESTEGVGALQPVTDAMRSLYNDTLGAPWLVVGVLLAAFWALWHALVRRRFVETAGAVAVSLAFAFIALAFVLRPDLTVGQGSAISNDMSTAFLSVTKEGTPTEGESAKLSASDQLFDLLIATPWAVLNFGGVEHCVRSGGDGEEPESVAVRPLDPATAAQLRTGTQVDAADKTCINNKNKYAARFLVHENMSAERTKEYEAIRDGSTEGLDDPSGYQLSAADKPAVDAMEAGGQFTRLLMAVVIFVGELGAFALLGALSVAVILAQVLVLLLLAFAPVALIVGILPGRGHDLFRSWISRIVSYMLRKAFYSLVLAVVLGVAAALAAASANLGWLMAFGLQALFFWTVFLYRKDLVGQLTSVVAGGAAVAGAGEGLRRMQALYYTRQFGRDISQTGRKVVSRAGTPVIAGAGTMARGGVSAARHGPDRAVRLIGPALGLSAHNFVRDPGSNGSATDHDQRRGVAVIAPPRPEGDSDGGRPSSGQPPRRPADAPPGPPRKGTRDGSPRHSKDRAAKPPGARTGEAGSRTGKPDVTPPGRPRRQTGKPRQGPHPQPPSGQQRPKPPSTARRTDSGTEGRPSPPPPSQRKPSSLTDGLRKDKERWRERPDRPKPPRPPRRPDREEGDDR